MLDEVYISEKSVVEDHFFMLRFSCMCYVA
jgi:hypothetical protein